MSGYRRDVEGWMSWQFRARIVPRDAIVTRDNMPEKRIKYAHSHVFAFPPFVIIMVCGNLDTNINILLLLYYKLFNYLYTV